MTKHARRTNVQLRHAKVATMPKVLTWQTYAANTTLVNTILLSVLALMMVSYLVVMNSAASDTFTVFELTRSIEETRESNEDMELAISEIQSLQHVKEQLSENTSMVSVSDVEYISADSAVALSR